MCVKSNFNVNFNVSFNSFLEQTSCAFSWINKRHDNTKMHGKAVKIITVDVCFHSANNNRSLAAV